MDAGPQLESLARELQRCRESWGQLRLREERYALALQGAGDGLWDWDLRTDRVHFCPRFRALVHGRRPPPRSCRAPGSTASTRRTCPRSRRT
jgi:hypothetical protein